MMRRSLICVAVLATLATGCSEPEPEATTEEVEADAPLDCAGDALLECARASTIGDLVPDTPITAEGEPITIGMINQENTPAGSYPELTQGVRAAIGFVNEQLGGLDGRPIELEVCNTNFSAEGSTTCGQRFVEEGVPVVMGGIDVFGNGIEVLAENDIPFVGGIPVSGQSVRSPNSFQWSGGSWGATIAFADYAAEELDAEKVAIVYGEFGSITESAEYARTVLDRAGVETQLVPYPIMSSDISSAIQAAGSGEPDAIFMIAADNGCAAGYEGMRTLGITAQRFFTGACVSPTILGSVDPEATEGTIFNVEGPISNSDPTEDAALYEAVIEQYGDGVDAIGAATVTFRAFMNLYAVMRDLGAEGSTPTGITESLSDQVDTPSFMGHPYTCDGQQIAELPAMCSPQQILGQVTDGELVQISDWIDVGAVHRG